MNHTKTNWKPGTMIYPLPAVLVSCGSTPEEYNLMTASWTGTICSEPPMCYVSIRRERHSYDIVKKNMEFVLNLTTQEMAKATDWCGVRSGKKFDKFKEMGLNARKGEKVNAAIVVESPINIECRVREILSLGSHDMFIADVLNVQVDERYIDAQTGKCDMEKMHLLVYVHGAYYQLGEYIGKFGWSVSKKTTE